MAIDVDVNETGIPNNEICFSFKYFKEESIRINGFNNFYQDKLDSINSVNDFFNTMREMGKYNKEVLFSKDKKRMFHLNKITDNKSINLIEKVLLDGYGYPQGFIDNFERTYIEFSIKNGKRVIAALMYGSLFECLFLDPNHLICPKKSRNIKAKEAFKIQSAFQKWSKEDLNMKTPMDIDYIEMVLDDYKTGKIETAEEALKTIDEYIVENKV